MIGETMARARRMHTSPFMSDHLGLIILGLGYSRKSGPFNPKLTETMLKGKTKKTAKIGYIIIVVADDGVQTIPPTTMHTNVAVKEKNAAKRFFALTRLFALIGDE